MHPDAPLLGSCWNERLVSLSRLEVYSLDGTSFMKPITMVRFKSNILKINFRTVNDACHILENSAIRNGIVGTRFVPLSYYRRRLTQSFDI